MKKIIALWVLLTLLFVTGNSFAVTDQFAAVEDSYISETTPNSNFGNEIVLLADGNDGSGGEVAALIKWDVSSIPSDATITAASITLKLIDSSSGAYNIIRQNTNWSENTVDWSDLSGSATIRGVIPPFSFGKVTIPLNEQGVDLVQGWVDGGFVNNGITIRTAGTTNGIDMDSRESGGIPRLSVTYTNSPPTIEELQAEVESLKSLLAGVNRTGNNINFDGVNVRIRNGLGATNGDPNCPIEKPCSANIQVNGLGNLIVGYDEAISPSNKTGSHNFVVGPGHSYPGYGGLVAGFNNTISGDFSSVSGGSGNFAAGRAASVSGGSNNLANGSTSSVSGGIQNEALASDSHVSGGVFNKTNGGASTVTGGLLNEANGTHSSVSGGSNRNANGTNDWVAGSLFEDH